jgi:hypothetical protein
MFYIDNNSILENFNNSIDDFMEPMTIHDHIADIIININFFTMLFGIFANIFSMIIFLQRELRVRKYNWYLAMLSFFDFTFCFIVFTSYLVLRHSNPTKSLFDLNIVTCFMTDYIVNLIDSCCVILTLILSIDRLYAILSPFNSRNFYIYRYPKKTAFITFVFLTIIKLPELFLSQREFRTNTLNNTNSSVSLSDTKLLSSCESLTLANRFVSTKKVKQQLYVIYCNIVLPILLNLIPALVIIILNSILWLSVHRYTNQIKLSITTKKRETSLGAIVDNNDDSLVIKKKAMTTVQKSHYFTILCIGLWLLFTSVPYYSLNTYYWVTTLSLIEDHSEWPMTIQAISSAFFNLNHCFNILIYLTFHRDYRNNSIILILNVLNNIPYVNIKPELLENIKKKRKHIIKRNTPSCAADDAEINLQTILIKNNNNIKS